MGEGFTWETQDRSRDVAAAERAWDKAKELMAREDIRLLVLDELNIALRYEYLRSGRGGRNPARSAGPISTWSSPAATRSPS